MSKSSSRISARSRIAAPGKTWSWVKWIAPDTQEAWIARLEAEGVSTWTLTDRVDLRRTILAVYGQDRAVLAGLARRHGGRLGSLRDKDWLSPASSPLISVGRQLQIVQEPAQAKPGVPSLVVPLGMAFGSGSHATTGMLLRALVRRGKLKETALLDLGTGSGILALAARWSGAKKIMAIDFDPDAVRIAAENETLNFSSSQIIWRRADVKKLGARPLFGLVLANLFSGILCEAAARITAVVKPGGELWMSGILREQEKEVIWAYRQRGLKLLRCARRGKWVMLQWRRGESVID